MRQRRAVRVVELDVMAADAVDEGLPLRARAATVADHGPATGAVEREHLQCGPDCVRVLAMSSTPSVSASTMREWSTTEAGTPATSTRAPRRELPGRIYG
jgi:hypothetical protein